MSDRLTTYADLAVGQRASFSKTVTEADIANFVACTGDVNPLHVNEPFAARTFFGRRIAHGMLTASLFSTVIGMGLPGTGAIYRSQTLEFLRPVYIGDTLTATMEIEALNPAEERIELKGWIENQHGERVVEGKAVASLLRGMRE